jgi:two-component system, NarL family, nitrate/nitrite response regulator NarL
MPKSILIVDDNDTSRKVSRSFVESQPDMEVCGEAADGLEGIEKAKSLKPDVVLLDVALPQMNGVEAASVIKREVPEARIVMLTVRDNSLGGEPLSSIVGVDAVLSKPDGGRRIIDCLRNVLQAA